MAYLFSQHAGRDAPGKTLTVDVYVARLDSKTLTPTTASFGFKTYVHNPPVSPMLLDEDKYIARFRQHWDAAIEQCAAQFGVTPDHFRELIASVPGNAEPVDINTAKVETAEQTSPETAEVTSDLKPVDLDSAELQTAKPEHPSIPHTLPEISVTSSIEEALRQSAKDGTFVSIDDIMAANSSAVQLNGLTTVAEDAASTTTNESTTSSHDTTTATSNTDKSVDRKAAKLNMLKRMRPPPFTNVWTFWHDKYVPPDPAKPSVSYANRLTCLYGEIHDTKEFYQIYNNTPVEHLRQRDSFHLFKRTVKPVWEDPRNVNGGSWTFRVPKDKSTEFWMMVQVMAVGEAFDDVIDAGPSKPLLQSHSNPATVNLEC